MKISKIKTVVWFTPAQLLVITLAALAAVGGAFIAGRYSGMDEAIKSATYYSDGADERGAFYELEFAGGRVDRYYWEEEEQ